MPNHKLLILRVILEPAIRRRYCCHKKEHVISKGELSIVVKEGQYKRKVYCKECALAMIKISFCRLKELEEKCNTHIC